MRKAALFPLVLAMFLPSWPSEPGQRMNCDDWVFLEPGFSCRELMPPDCKDNPWCHQGKTLESDNDGNLIIVRRLEGLRPCSLLDVGRTEIVLFELDTQSERVLAYVEDRCGDGIREQLIPRDQSCGSLDCRDFRLGPVLTLDRTNGQLVTPLQSRCQLNGAGGGSCQYGNGIWLASFAGFTTLFEVLQTYTPSSNTLSFRVPYMPEGFERADWFDTYWGDLSTVGDWSQAKGLQCHYPSTPPSVGDYLTVADTLPTAAPGQGYYYVTTVTFQGQRRYGRKASGGQLSGRDPAVLPICSQ